MINKLNLILDLDETLIYSYYGKYYEESIMLLHEYNFSFDKHDNIIEINPNMSIYSNNITEPHKFYVFIRPHLISFLITVSKYYNLILYTNATLPYTKNIINYIDQLICLNKCKNNDTIYSIWYNPISCNSIFNDLYYRNNNNLIKTLKRINDPTVNIYNTIIVDDNINAWDPEYHNIIYNIPKFNPHLNSNYKNDIILTELSNSLIIHYYDNLLKKH